MHHDDREQAEVLVHDPDFQWGLRGLANAFLLRWLQNGSGCDSVSVAAQGPGGPVMRFLIAAAPPEGEGARILEAGERAFYRALSLRDPSRREGRAR